MLQSKTVVVPALAIAAVGANTSCVMTICSVSVQPFAAVAVTVYVPGAVTDKAAAVPTTPVALDQE